MSRRWRWRWLSWRVSRQLTTCAWYECDRPLPPIRTSKRFCSEACADADWEFEQI